jgi:ABC-2 type transport system ATP-binding protein
VLGLLGHNGAGKTTLVNILSTLLPLSGVENLVLIARLLGASRRGARQRAEELLTVFDLNDAAKRQARTYSGGMRRRLDIAASLVGQPDVIFLDEPTAGLEPVSRMSMWQIVEDLVAEGTTVLLTTQYLDEADRLADSITVLSAGKVAASGTAEELKAQVGQRTVTTTLADSSQAGDALRALAAAGFVPTHDENRKAITVPVAASRDLASVVRALNESAIEIDGLELGEPTLDDVYLALAHRSPASAA